jgi:D-serine deaminase-like pyridoxal phosphate-dependent protein
MTVTDWDTTVGLPVEALDTPAVIIDLDRVDRNITTLQNAVSAAGADFRVHIKTHKTPALAHRQLAAGAVGITAAKLSEAEVFVADGIEDVVIAYPVYGFRKWQRAAQLARDARLVVHVENEAALDGWEAAAKAAGVNLGIRVEINTGFDRSGVRPADAVLLARQVEKARHLTLDGLTTHRSAFFAASGGRPLDDLGDEEGRIMTGIAESVRAQGIEVRTVAGGSTPTARSFARVAGTTEACAGTYIFFDVGMHETGACGWDEIAVSMLCTVVSVNGRRVTVDGGSKTFCKDGYGPHPTAFGRAVEGTAYLAAVTEEHGMAQLGESDPVPRVGDKLAFHPMHVCPTINLTDTLIGVRGGIVEEVFAVSARGKTW